jgi:pyruvate/2-oxoglutarate/acetoin dehydrogenase E1 component
MAVKGPVPAEDYEIEFGKARVVQEGGQITVVAIGAMVQRAVAAARELGDKGFSIEIIDPRTVSPLDTNTILASLKKTGRLLIVEEVFSPCSLSAEIAAHAADSGFDSLDAPVKRINCAFTPTPYSPALEKAVIPSIETIAGAMRGLIQE